MEKCKSIISSKLSSPDKKELIFQPLKEILPNKMMAEKLKKFSDVNFRRKNSNETDQSEGNI